MILRAAAGRIDRLVDRGARRRARDLLALGDRELAEAVGLEPAVTRAAVGSGARAELRDRLDGEDCWVICRHEPDWPAQLELLGPAAPRALFARGGRERLQHLASEPAVTMVGARRAGPYGLEVGGRLAEDVAAAGLPVLSGLAFGIDTVAHEGAIRGRGLTAAILAAGPERAYPRSRARLYREICRDGLVLSELPLDSPTFRWMFPARNRVMAALSSLTVVVEAAERSGSLITAEMAADCGRLVGAVPGPVNSWRSTGCNMLIADGAALIRDGRDVLELLLGPGAEVESRAGPALDAGERAVLGAIEGGAVGVDAAAAATGRDATLVAAAFARLELAGYIEIGAAGGCRRTVLRAPAGGPVRASTANTMGG